MRTSSMMALATLLLGSIGAVPVYAAPDTTGCPPGMHRAEAEGGGVVLVGCDRGWHPVWRTACTSVEVAERQAEFEYAGVSRTWARVCR